MNTACTLTMPPPSPTRGTQKLATLSACGLLALAAAFFALHNRSAPPAPAAPSTAPAAPPAAPPPTAVAGDWTDKCVAVTDGDTIKVMHDGREEKIRLNGIDCPEHNQDFGSRAKEFGRIVLPGT